MNTPVIFDAANFPLEKGTTLIEASAGTGKTFSIAALYLRLVLEEELPVPSILAVTYTTAATKELRERVRSRLRDAAADLETGEAREAITAKYLAAHPGPEERRPGLRRLELAVQSFDDARIFTIHGFCQRVLQERAFESGARYGVELTPDARPLLEEVAADFWRKSFQNAPPLVAALAAARGESPGAWADLLEETRNHPALRLIPEPFPPGEPGTRLAAAFAALQEAWRRGGAGFAAALEADKTLTPTQRRDRVALLPVLARLAGEPDAELLGALEHFTSKAIEKATGKNKTPLSHPLLALCDAFFAAADAFFIQLTHEALAYAATELPERKRRRGVLTYDDLLGQIHAALSGPRGGQLARAVGSAYQAALIDEFQDTDPLQAEIFQHFFGGGGHRLFLIGDPKQAIYGFRGADIFTYMAAARAADHRATLTTNWRSSEALLQGFNALFSRRPDPFVFEGIQYHPVHSNDPEIPPGTQPALELRWLPGEGGKALAQDAAVHRLADAVAADAARLHEEGWQWGDLAVLARTHWQAEAVYEALSRRGLHGVMHTDESVFHSPQAAELQALLEAALEPARQDRLNAALATPFGGLGANALAEMTPETRQQWVERFSQWRGLWRENGFAVMFRRVLLSGGDLYRRVMETPKGPDGGERRLTNYLHLAELLHEAETAGRFTPEALIDWLTEQRTSRHATPEAAQLRLESDGDAVQIVTVHQSKGLEYEAVLCPFLWCPADSSRRKRVRFHDGENRLSLDLRGKDGADPADVTRHTREALAEETRLLYVAVTRARRRCVVYLGEIQKAEDSALAYLLGGDLQTEAKTLGAAFPERVQWSEIGAEGGGEVDITESPIKAPEQPLAARVFPGTIRPPAFLTSFTGLAAGTGGEAPERDRPAPPPLAGDGEAGEETAAAAGIFQFEKGAKAGVFFHDVLERLDFQEPGGIGALVEARLAAYGLANAPHREALAPKLAELLEVELAPGLTLSKIPLSERFSEAEFSARLPSLRPEDLREALAGAASPLFEPEDLARLRFTRVEGFLRGFIDLFFRHEGRYYIVDWKSNWLGERPQDYDAPALAAAMREHLYGLQAHLYVLAADRFLASRLPGYDYERDFGGVFYLFLRGVERGNPQRGICRMRPPLEVVEKLRALTRKP